MTKKKSKPTKRTNAPSNFQVRQGDVYVDQVAKLPANAKKVARDAGRVILAYGEVTGHAHAIVSPNATLWENADGTRFLEVKRAVRLQHEEHSTINIPAGVFHVIRQREYSPEAIRFVAD